MKTKRIPERSAVAVGLCLLFAVPGAGWAQGEPPAPAHPPPGHMTIVPDSKLKHADPMDDFAGVNFTAEQKARIEQIREQYRSRMHEIAVDTKVSPEQRSAMLEGTQRLERGEVFRVLTPEQQAEVRKRVLARRQAQRKETTHQAQSTQTPTQPLAQPLPH